MTSNLIFYVFIVQSYLDNSLEGVCVLGRLNMYGRNRRDKKKKRKEAHRD